MARELNAAFEELSGQSTTVLVLEDLHWTDPGTVELLRAMARRTERRGLVLVATFAPHNTAPAPLLRLLSAELDGRDGSATLRLQRLSPAAVRRYLALRFETEALDRLTRPLHATTQGHPLCLVAALEALTIAGHLHETAAGWRLDLPSRLLEPVLSTALLSALSRQFDRLDEEDRTLLQAAAAVGIEFSPDDVACALDTDDSAAVEHRLGVLAERGFVLSTEPEPGASIQRASVEYRFPHASHAEAMLIGTTPFQQLRVAERLAGAGERQFPA